MNYRKKKGPNLFRITRFTDTNRTYYVMDWKQLMDKTLMFSTRKDGLLKNI